MKKKLNLNKSTKNTLITIGMVVVAYIIMTILASAGALSSLMKGLLVPLCIYAIIAVALNLTVGILGELSLGHAGFMCIGAFTSAFLSKCLDFSFRLCQYLNKKELAFILLKKIKKGEKNEKHD